MMLFHFYRLIFSIFLICCNFQLASAHNHLSRIPLLVGETRDTNGKLLPMDTTYKRYIEYIERELKIRFEFQYLPIPRVIELAQKGQGLAFGMSKTSQRLQTLAFSEPVMSNMIWLVLASDSNLQFNNLSDLKGKTIGLVRGMRINDEFDSQRNKLFQVDENLPFYDSRLIKVLLHRVDAQLFDSHHTNAQALENQLNQIIVKQNILPDLRAQGLHIKVFPKPLMVDDIHFTLALHAVQEGKEGRILLDKINAALIKGRKTGALPPLMSR